MSSLPLLSTLMGHPTGFLQYERQAAPYRPVHVRLEDFGELYTAPDPVVLKQQGARCMDCGVPFCQSAHGCPVDNLIPEWNDLVFAGRWREALARLHRTNNFPEFTGRVCPAPCETACVLGHTAGDPVTIKAIEHAIVERGWAEGWIVPEPPKAESGFSVGIVGSGPAGLAAAQQLRRRGHAVTVYERADRVGGLLTYGIPNMKLGKDVIERRIAQLKAEGVAFETGVAVGTTVSASDLRARHDALLFATGSTRPRDLDVPGRALGGVHFAVPYLADATREALGDGTAPVQATGKHVVVIGGGDTGTDCIATALRQGCTSLVAFELLDEPPADRPSDTPWPRWPRILRSDYGHEEAKAVFGADPRAFAVMTTGFVEDDGRVAAVETVEVAWETGRPVPIPGSERRWPADLVLIAAGYVGAEPDAVSGLDVPITPRGTLDAPTTTYATNVDGVFAAGDCRRGQSLVVWAIREGRDAADAVDGYLRQR